MFSLLHCKGTAMDCATILYGILQEGGLAEHEHISAGDKDYIPVLGKIACLVTKDIFNLAKVCGETTIEYSTADIEKLLSKDNLEVLGEEHWLEDVYGAQSRLYNDAWLAKVSNEGKWIFDSKDMRRRIFAQAGVKYHN